MALKQMEQTSIFDRTIESPEIEEAIAIICEARADGTMKRLAKASKTIRTIVEEYNLAEGERLRVGQYVVTGKRRSGGGFEVPMWEKTGVGSIASLIDE